MLFGLNGEVEDDIDLTVDVLYVVEGDCECREGVGNYYAVRRRRLHLNAGDRAVDACSYYC